MYYLGINTPVHTRILYIYIYIYTYFLYNYTLRGVVVAYQTVFLSSRNTTTVISLHSCSYLNLFVVVVVVVVFSFAPF